MNRPGVTCCAWSFCFAKVEKKYYFIFAKTGFTKGCIAKAGEIGNVKLVAYAEMTEGKA